jgi:hypothetical protein
MWASGLAYPHRVIFGIPMAAETITLGRTMDFSWVTIAAWVDLGMERRINDKIGKDNNLAVCFIANN